nr:MAG TPA: hypothetical protein [Caudoviricetes sp.]
MTSRPWVSSVRSSPRRRPASTCVTSRRRMS